MTMTDNPGHVRLAPTASTRAASATAMSTSSPWIFDTKKRNRLLKKYRTQVASATSTVFATLSVVCNLQYAPIIVWALLTFLILP